MKNSHAPSRQVVNSFIALTTCFAATLVLAQEIPWASSAEEVGMSTERLGRINDVIQRHIDAGNIQGAVTAVARRGKIVHFEAHGLMDVPKNLPMARDNIFIMMSSTKPVLGVAAMMMIEEGRMRPSDPVSKWIPEFADMQVAVLADPLEEEISPIRVNQENLPDYRLISAAREITVHDILSHTSGLASGGLGSAISAQVDRRPPANLGNTVSKFGDYVLDFQPGSRWQYSAATALDVVARIVEIESGLPFERFVQERIFEPLSMNNTWWNVPPEFQDRRVVIVDRDMSRFFDEPDTEYFSGSYGLNSTADDYLRFEQMLVNGGELFGNRLLSPRTVRMMASDQANGLYQGISRQVKGQGFGYTVAVSENPILGDQRRSTGTFGWGGAFGTRSYSDPKEELTAVFMVQQPYRPAQNDFENAVQQAIID